MKILLTSAVAGLLFLGSCAQKKENREEYKAEHDKEYMKNSLGDTAVNHSEPVPPGSVGATVQPKDTMTEKSVNQNKQVPDTERGGYR
ncbi:hypothetical protein ASG01_08705 [Chryseobacterium sp. Leaf180]|jgi:hypothetical protein|uniref:hypothetical protein n=1 Tax=Chryseobacterium sp. Leaf180 TaxID=1736289 RepID=UPI0006FFBC05|nr:hypothetical protein [Chryseobacterium sp. Leaf180]KQR93268.1 hypothetical protein ASG01_08705 [Chryseobacterium sp. Leaf180]